MRIEISGLQDFGKLEAMWRALEAEAGDFSFFQGWTWVGCLAEERFTDPVLVHGHDGGRTVALALFNRRADTLFLTESGDAAFDSVFIEHNGPLVAASAEPGAAARLLRAAAGMRGIRRVVLSGVAPALAAAAGGVAATVLDHAAPHVELGLHADEAAYLASRSANTRAQLRRSLRHFARHGQPAIAQPAGVGEALGWLDGMMALHQERWHRAGAAGAFATGTVRRFHAALLERAMARGELDLARVAAGEVLLGYLYGFRHRGTVSAYQSGFCRFEAGNDARPGLVAHLLAITAARQAGLRRYDFLAGAARYKLSLATGATTLSWQTRVSARSPLAALALARGLARRLRDWLSAGRARTEGD
jgi:CelD/BcsL family acetyltransferase involved in cellulose biosynthesis